MLARATLRRVLHFPASPLSDGVVTLRPKTLEDVEAIVEACQDPEIARWTRVPSPYTPTEATGWIEACKGELEAGTAIDWLVIDAAGAMAGSIGLMDIDRARSYGKIGYWVAAPARGRGVASRALRLVRDWGAGELGLRHIEVLVHERNEASLAVARRAGFEDTGQRRVSPREEAPDGRYVVFAAPAPAPALAPAPSSA